ncbi:hypothetical protein NR352_00920 [Enterobacter soli]|uniref:hypothetical protein n=1 Tax=Enterobacter soli TaxID=885040 RepID=UPI0021487FAC|nr:hypothetical protein [Enterobacter soli]MCR1315627.1 hypothetical protein [Enterobacter soli]
MDLNPLLVFNAPAPYGVSDRLRGGGGETYFPPRQGARIFPRLDAVEQKFAEFIHLADAPDGFVPEKILVLEIAGDPGELANRLSRIEGLEFMTSTLMEAKYTSEDFFTLDKNGNRKPVTRTVYLSMSNQAGLHRLRRMWEEFEKNGTIPNSFTPAINAFNQLIDVRVWDTQDRLGTTHLLEDWAERIHDAVKWSTKTGHRVRVFPVSIFRFVWG